MGGTAEGRRAGTRTWVIGGVTAGVVALGALALGTLAVGSDADESATPSPHPAASRYAALTDTALRRADAATQRRFAAVVDADSMRLAYASPTTRVYLAMGRTNDAGRVCRVTVLASGAAGAGCVRSARRDGAVSVTASALGAPDGALVLVVPDGVRAVDLPDGSSLPVRHNVAVREGVADPPMGVGLVPAGADRMRLRVPLPALPG